MTIKGLDIQIIRSKRRKTLCINIERDGSVNVLVPKDMEEDAIYKIVSAKEYDIFKRIEKWKELNKEAITRRFVEGQSFMYLGKNYNLHIVENDKEVLKLKEGKFIISEKALPKAEELFVKFYKKSGKRLIEERIENFSKYISKQPNNIRIVDLKTRWASCTPSGNLNFHWKCIMAPSIVLDYLVVHELVHLIHPNHSRAFWDELSVIFPKYKDQEDWLKRNGVRMTL